MIFDNRSLWVLMWRHMKERRHRTCYTVFEICSGVLVFLIMVLTRQNLLNQTKSLHVPLVEESDVMRIFYAPDNETIEKFMAKVGNELALNKISNFSDINSEGYRSFKSADEIHAFLKETQISDPVGVVIFENIASFWHHLNYSIEYIVTQPYVLGKSSTPSDMINYRLLSVTNEIPSALVKLQWAIDKTYLREISGSDISAQSFEVEELSGVLNPVVEVLHGFLIICTVLATLPFFLFNSSRLVVEKQSGLKELMKLVGVSPSVVRMSHLLETALVGSIHATLITVVLKSTSNPILPNSSGIIVAVTIVLHFVSITSLAFITSTLSQDYQHASGLAIIIYMMSYLIVNVWYNYEKKNSISKNIVSWLFPHGPVYVFWNEVTSLEKIGEGTIFGNMATPHSPKSLSVLLVWLCFVIQLALVLTLSWYLDLVRPGRYGVAKKWHFVFQKEFWHQKKKKVTFHVTVEQNQRLLRDDRFFESGPDNTEVAIKVVNITKVFFIDFVSADRSQLLDKGQVLHNIFRGFRQPRVIALDSVNLDVYRGEVTVLLGANGAGKTTLLSIITGMYSASSGNVYVNGMDISNRIQKVHKDLGFCPQHNLTFDYLTVRENIIFFERLKGEAREDACSSAEHLMEKLRLNDRADYYSYQLSAGLKRCLQVACAMAGGAEVLVLDEPTSGMDSDSRHSLWDIILSLRGNTTILMTTAIIEEADVLGDRIALLNGGRLRCYGTPTFLKQAIGTGFNLVITLKHKQFVGPVQELVLTTVPDSTSKELERKRVTFTLPYKGMELFPKLFDALEEDKVNLGIVGMEVGMSMEDVFLEFIDEEDEIDDPLLSVVSCHNMQDVKLEGWRLFKQRMLVLIKRNIIFLWSKKYQFIVLQVIVPIFGLLMITLTSNRSYSATTVDRTVDDNESAIALYETGPYRSRGLVEPLQAYYPNVEFVHSNNVTRDVIELINTRARDDRNKQIYALQMNENRTRIYYSRAGKASLSRAINLFSNVFISLHMPYAINNTIHLLRYVPVLLRARSEGIVEAKNAYLCYNWSTWVVFLSVLPMAPLVWMCIREMETGVRYNHFIVGCPSHILWLAKLIVHMPVYIAIVPISLLILARYLESDHTLNESTFLGFLLLISLIFGLAFLVHLYVFSFVLSASNATTQIYITSLCFALVMPTLEIPLMELKVAWMSALARCIDVLANFSPIYTYSSGLFAMTNVARMNAYCRLNRHHCPNFTLSEPLFSTSICCESTSDSPFGYFVSYDTGLFDLMLMIGQIIFYGTLLVLLQNRALQSFVDHLLNCTYAGPPPMFVDAHVQKEQDYVTEQMKCFARATDSTVRELSKISGDMLLVKKLHKNYTGSLCGHRCNAVRGVSFAVKQGECLGILGPTCAGKTTTLMMISGYTVMTKGDSWAGGYFLRRDRNDYLRSISMTFATGGLDEFLSGYDNLKLLSSLYGRPERVSAHLANRCLLYMGLESYSNAHLETYSAGCSRRLGVCGVLLAAPRVVLLDEPAAHVDLRTRPLVTRALRRMRDGGAALLLAEQSMDWREMESVCTRIAIMSRGQLAAIGTADEVRRALNPGLTARLRLKIDAATGTKDTGHDPYKVYLSQDSVQSLKNDFKEQFTTSYLADEHLSMLYYHIRVSPKQKLLYSEIFTKLDALKTKHAIIVDDYTLSVTSIDDVFYMLEH